MTDEFFKYVSPPLAAGIEFTNNCVNLPCKSSVEKWVLVAVFNTIAYLIYFALALFEAYSNWELLLDIGVSGLNNPLLPAPSIGSQNWFYMRCFVVFLSTFITLISLIIDGIALAYIYIKNRNTSEKSNNPVCQICKELFFFVLWLEELMLLIMLVIFAWTQYSCRTPNLTPIMIEVGISATAILLVSCWRIFFSFIQVYLCYKTELDSLCHFYRLCFGFVFVMQLLVVIVGAAVTIASWSLSVARSNGADYENSFGIYRSPPKGDDSQLLRMSDIITPSGEALMNLEMIPYAQQQRYLGYYYLPPRDIYCLSRFEYRSQESEIAFNVIEVTPLSSDGRFCTMSSDAGRCDSYYLNGKLYYASTNPTSGKIERYNDYCLATKWYSYNPFAPSTVDPKFDSGINVSHYINHTDFNTYENQLVVHYPNISMSVPFSNISQAGGIEVRIPLVNGNGFCVVKLAYSYLRSAVIYDYLEVTTNQTQCSCKYISPLCFAMLNQTAVYSYMTSDSRIVKLTKCLSFSYQKLVPRIDRFLSVSCPC